LPLGWCHVEHGTRLGVEASGDQHPSSLAGFSRSTSSGYHLESGVVLPDFLLPREEGYV